MYAKSYARGALDFPGKRVAPAPYRTDGQFHIDVLGLAPQAADDDVRAANGFAARMRIDARRVAARKNRALSGECSSGWLKNVASCSVTHTGTPVANGIV